MHLFVKFKNVLGRGSRATLNFRKFKVALNPLPRTLYKRLKLNVRVFLAGDTEPMVTLVPEMNLTSEPLYFGKQGAMFRKP